MPAALAIAFLLALAGYLIAKVERGRPRILQRHPEAQRDNDDHEGS